MLVDIHVQCDLQDNCCSNIGTEGGKEVFIDIYIAILRAPYQFVSFFQTFFLTILKAFGQFR